MLVNVSLSFIVCVISFWLKMTRIINWDGSNSTKVEMKKRKKIAGNLHITDYTRI
jgi:hypothetical protein